MTRPTIVIGDVHGLDYWREAISDSQGCRVVFLRDYLDPYQKMSHRELLDNLRAIIALKHNRPDDILLMPMGVSPRELDETTPLALEHCIREGWRFCDRLHIALFGNREGV